MSKGARMKGGARRLGIGSRGGGGLWGSVFSSNGRNGGQREAGLAGPTRSKPIKLDNVVT